GAESRTSHGLVLPQREHVLTNFSGKVNELKRCRGNPRGRSRSSRHVRRTEGGGRRTVSGRLEAVGTGPQPSQAVLHPPTSTLRGAPVLSSAPVITPAPALSQAEQQQVLSRVTRRLVLFAFVCYVVAYVDRVNIGFAATALQRD